MSANRTQWMRDARFGVFLHFLADAASTHDATALSIDAWNARVDAFDVDALADQLAKLGVGAVGLTLGQNSGYYCSPNATYDRLVDAPQSKLSRRDLMLDLATAMKRRSIRVIAYCPSHAPAHDPRAVQQLRCVPPWDASLWSFKRAQWGDDAPGVADARLTEFQLHWNAILAEWSTRFGDRVDAWWIDGCYFADRMYLHESGPNFRDLARAMRAGNADALVTFNEGIRRPRLSSMPGSGRDYFSGEADFSLPVNGKWYDGTAVWPDGGMVDGEQLMVFTFLGRFWGQGPTRFNDALAAGYTKHVCDAGGFMLWDVPFNANGTLPADVARQLRAMGTMLRE